MMRRWTSSDDGDGAKTRGRPHRDAVDVNEADSPSADNSTP